MGVVYKARDLNLDRIVALKLLPQSLLLDDAAKQRFVREARLASALDHPNICTIYEVGETEEGKTFIAMACYEGETLATVIDRGPLPVDTAVAYARQISEGLSRAHEIGIVHRDIKPANVMVLEHDGIKLLDFGLATRYERTQLTQAGSIMGTAAYMSPEQAIGQKVDHRTDLWSLGVLLYEMLAGSRPFRGTYEQAVLYAILHEEPEPVRTRRPDVPTHVARIVDGLLRKNPDERIQNARNVVTALRNTDVGRSAASAAQLAAGASLRRWIWPAVTVALLVGAGGGLLVHQQRADPQSGTEYVVASIDVRPLAVLPFASLSQDPQDEYLADSMTEELIGVLGRLEGVRMIARGSSFAFKGKRLPLSEIARQLQVDYVIDGSVRRNADRLRVSAQLVAIDGEYAVWTETYDRDISDVFSVQEEIARSVASALDLRLPRRLETFQARSHVPNLRAYEVYLQGRHAWRRRTREGLELAIGYFREAIERDSSFAEAYAGLADAYLLLAGYRYRRPEEVLPRARQAVTRALFLDERLAEAHASLGNLIELEDPRARDSSRAAFKRAIEINPNYASAHHWYGMSLMRWGLLDEALREIRLASEQDPLTPPIHAVLGEILYLMGEHVRAEETCLRAHEMAPDFYAPLLCLSKIYAALGREADALWAARRGISLAPGNPVATAHLARVYAQVGDRSEALEIRTALEAEPSPCGECIADVSVALGDFNHALQWFNTEFWDHPIGFYFPNLDPMYDGLREDPRFISYLEALGMD